MTSQAKRAHTQRLRVQVRSHADGSKVRILPRVDSKDVANAIHADLAADRLGLGDEPVSSQLVRVGEGQPRHAGGAFHASPLGSLVDVIPQTLGIGADEAQLADLDLWGRSPRYCGSVRCIVITLESSGGYTWRVIREELLLIREDLFLITRGRRDLALITDRRVHLAASKVARHRLVLLGAFETLQAAVGPVEHIDQ